MTKRLLIDAIHAEEIRVVIADDTKIHEFDISASAKTQNKGNIYLAKVTRVEPSLQAAFVEYGAGRQGFLPFSEIHPDYYQIPVADRQRLLEEVAADGYAEDAPAVARNTVEGEAVFTAVAENPETVTEDAAGTDELTIADTSGEREDTAPAYLQEAIVEPPSVESEIVDELFDSVKEAQANEEAEEQEEDENEEAVGEAREVETMGDEDEFTRRRKAAFLKRYKIQEVIKRNQIMLVQVIKEERGNKGASLSTYISLAGRYCVLMPNSPKTGGISRKISNSEDRKRLKKISEEIRLSNGMSAIIRTAGIDRTRAEIKRDYDYLVKLWNQIRETTISSTAPTLVHEEADIVKRSLRDLYAGDLKEVVVAGHDAYKRAKDFMKLMMPSHAARVKEHQEATPIFYSYNVEDQLLYMHEPHVRLDSGGSIVLSPTEALVSIDVNSGRSTTERNVEETALKTNLEAAQEIARQLRLRDLAGLIVIDFIDMFDYKNRRAVERQLKESLKSDRAKIQVGRISPFGLLEMSRQRLRPSLSETNTTPCPHCEGKGFILSPHALGMQLIRLLEREASSGEYSTLRLKVTQATAMYLLNSKREKLLEIERAHSISISVEISDQALSASGFVLERTTHQGQKSELSGLDGVPSQGKRQRQRKRKRDKDRDRSGYRNPTPGMDAQEEDMEESSVEDEMQEPEVIGTPQEDEEGRGRDRGDRDRRRRRGGRRRDRNRDRDGRQEYPRAEGENFDAAPPENLREDAVQNMESAPEADLGEASGDRSRIRDRRRGGMNRRRQKNTDRRPQHRQAEGEEQPAAAPPRKQDSQEASYEQAPAPHPAPKKESVAEAPKPAPRKEREPVLADGEPGKQDDKPTKRGWWRRIVE